MTWHQACHVLIVPKWTLPLPSPPLFVVLTWPLSISSAHQCCPAQVRMRALTIGFFVLSAIFYTFVGLNSCNSFALSWLGYMPVILVRR